MPRNKTALGLDQCLAQQPRGGLGVTCGPELILNVQSAIQSCRSKCSC